jgi:hypothetical protein
MLDGNLSSGSNRAAVSSSGSASVNASARLQPYKTRRLALSSAPERGLFPVMRFLPDVKGYAAPGTKSLTFVAVEK